MRIVPQALGQTDQLPRVYGRFYTRVTRWGIVVQAWPRSFVSKYKPYNLYMQEQWKYAGRLSTAAHWLQLATANYMAKGTEFVPRDLLIKAMFAKVYTYNLPDGTTAGSAYDVTPNPQLTLDMVSDVPGSILYRSLIGWEGLPPGNAGYIATMKDGMPSWQPGGGITPGAGQWTLQQSQAIGSPTGNVDFININASEIMLLFDAVTASIGTGARAARVSLDNGATWLSTNGDYQTFVNGGVANNATSITLQTVSSAAAVSGAAWIDAANVTGTKKIWRTSLGTVTGMIKSGNPITGVRLFHTTGNLTGGTVSLFVR